MRGVRARRPRRRAGALRGAAPEDVTMRVAIVGGGIGGMALGLSLRGAGIADVDVYEATSTVNELGVGINVLPHPVRELTELGRLEPASGVRPYPRQRPADALHQRGA